MILAIWYLAIQVNFLASQILLINFNRTEVTKGFQWQRQFSLLHNRRLWTFRCHQLSVVSQLTNQSNNTKACNDLFITSFIKLEETAIILRVQPAWFMPATTWVQKVCELHFLCSPVPFSSSICILNFHSLDSLNIAAICSLSSFRCCCQGRL